MLLALLFHHIHWFDCFVLVIHCLWPCSLAITSTGWVSLWFLWFYVQEYPKAKPAVVLVLKRPRSLKSRPTDWEKTGIEHATPRLQDIGLSPTLDKLGSLHASLTIYVFNNSRTCELGRTFGQ